jgi:hypothetical protein
LQLAHQKLPPGERLQFRPIAPIGKFRPPRQNPRPSEGAEYILRTELRYRSYFEL